MQDFNLGKNAVMSISEAPVQGSIPKLTTVCRRFICGRQYCQMIRVMKCTFICLLVFCLQVHAGVYSQAITFSGKNVSLKKVFTAIEKQTAYVFFYNDEILVGARPVTLNVKNASIQAVLDVCLQGQQLEWSIEDKTVFITKKASAKSVVYVEHEQLPIDVTGRVTDEQGNPLVGANVRVKGSDVGVVTDEKGEFVLKNINESALLEVSYVGFDVQVIPIKESKNINIRLRGAVKELDATIIKGYYTTTKRLNTGSVGKVTSSTLDQQPINNPLQAMQGRVSGLLITQSTGVPGSGYNVQIRGQNSLRNTSFDNGNRPLFVIDGVPFTATSLSSPSINYIVDGGNPLNTINPSDIESIEILKDADATAIYGSRGANGVVLITTKKGSSGKTQVDLNFYTGIGKVPKFMDLLKTEKYLEMRHEAFSNDGVSPIPDNAYDINGTWDTTRYTDWQKELIGGTANINDVQAAISGGNSNTQFYFGSGYRRETTVFPGDFSYSKASVYVNMNHTSSNGHFKLTLSSNYVYDKNNLLQGDLLLPALQLPPNAPPIFNEEGKLNWENSTWSNPFALLQRKYVTNNDNLISNALLSYQILKGLVLQSNFGFTKMTTDETAITPITSWQPSFGVTEGFSYFTNGNLKTWIVEPQIEYTNIQNKLKWSSLIGLTFQQTVQENQTNLALGITNDASLENIAAASRVVLMENNHFKYKYNAIFARINLNWDNKYLLNLTGRRDGSSRFGPGKQFANFGAVGVAWLFSEEKILRASQNFLSFGKIRGSYGITGNDQIGDYGYFDTYSATTFPYQNRSGLYPTGLSNTSYGWETNKKLEGGIELGLLKSRLMLTVNHYRNRSSNQLVGYSLAPTTGFSSIQLNLPAVVQNTGWEFELKSTNLKTPNFTWTTTANLTIPKNKLISYPNIEGSNYNYIYAVGKPLNIVYAFHYKGVDPQTGVFTFEDVDNDGTISWPNDLLTYNKLGPIFYGGFENHIEYKQWQLGVFFQFVKQTGKGFLSGGIFQLPGMLGNQSTEVLNRWRKPNDMTNMQLFSQDFGSAAYQGYVNAVYVGGDNLIEDASFIRLKNINLTYSLPQDLTKAIKIQNVRLFIQGQNLFTITGFTGVDPENSGTGRLPPLRMITVGFHATL
jgi:TonB-linked outer membrane protein, SusC/RagA family